MIYIGDIVNKLGEDRKRHVVYKSKTELSFMRIIDYKRFHCYLRFNIRDHDYYLDN